MNSKSEKLKESKTEEQIYEKIKKKYFDIQRSTLYMDKELKKQKEEVKKQKEELKRMNDREDKRVKELILNAKREYGIETEIIEPLLKIVSKKEIMSYPAIEKAMRICKVLKVRNLEDLKENKENIDYLLLP